MSRKHRRLLPSLLTAGAVVLAPPLAGQASRGTASATTMSQDQAIPLDSAVRSGTLPNGLRYYVRRNARPEKRLELRLVLNVGSVLETDAQRGLAHFTEHMLFNGTRRFKKNDIVSYLESIGVRFGADLNAYTGFDETVYILPVPTDKPGLVERSFDILEDWASGATFDSTEVEKERGVVMEEWRLGLGADSRIRDKQFPVVFQGSRYAVRLPIGDTAVILHTPPSEVRKFYDTWYRPDLMAVVAVGDYDPARLEALVKERFSRLKVAANAPARPVPSVPGNDSTLLAIATDKEQPVSTIEVLYKHPAAAMNTMRDYRSLLVRRLYNQILNSRLTELTRKPDAPFSFGSSSYGSFVRSTDIYVLSASVPDGGVLRGLDALLQEAKRVDSHGFLQSELDRARTSLLRSLESAYAERDKSESGAYADEYVQNFLTHEPAPGIGWEYETAKRVLPGVTLDEINALGRQFITEKNRVIVVAAPDKPEAKVPTSDELLAAFHKADATTVAAYTETVSAAPLVATTPPKGRIVSESAIPELGVTDWRLSNGVRVLVKPTDFKADEILMTAFSPGGASLVADSDYAAAVLATTAVGVGGIATFPITELSKKLAGKRATANPSITDVSQGINGSASPRDLELLMQLTYLRMTAPRRDSAAFDALRAQYMPYLRNQENTPEQVFADTVVVTMGQHHPRARPLTADLLASISYSRAYDIYRERFGDASGMTFVFVGAVNVDSLRPLAEQWLASLPATGRQETWRDVGMRPPEGVVERTVYKGIEPKASTSIFFTGPAPYTPETRYALRSLADLLEMRLIDNLRERLGGTYSPQVQGLAGKAPHEDYQVTIGYGSAPDRVDTLFKSVMAVIDSVKRLGVTDADVQKVREQQQRLMETQQKENNYWLANIAGRIENGEDPRGLLQYADFIKGLTGAQIQEAAKRYLDTSRYARFTLLPEQKAPSPPR